MLLSVKTRQKYLKELGYYTGEIDGHAGKLTKKAYAELQNDYFTRKKDRDGNYGKDTDKLLRCAYNCRDLKHFKLTEFKCGCKTKYCTGYPVELNRNLLLNLDDMRKHYGKSMNVKSGMRCKKYNSTLKGSSTNSYHLKGKACDFQMTGKCSTHNGRKELVKYWCENYKTARHSYCDGYRIRNGKVSYPNADNMGRSVHVDVK